MQQAEKFYPELHKAEATYSAGTCHMESLLSHGVIDEFARQYRGKTIRLLDVGCGKGLFIRDFVRALRERWSLDKIEVTGTDLVRSPGDLFKEVSPDFKFVQYNLDGQPLPFPDRSFDFVCCNHVLEHIFSTEDLVREFRRVLDAHGLCLISVPNLAAWINRAAFIFAGQPLGSELGTEKITYGFWPGFLQPKLEKFRPSGHIRDFTPRGLEGLTTHCGFRTVGWWKQSVGPIARLGKWAGRNMGILLKHA
jgi:SAM-dependent methyltransferase